jgi:tetratricopeptide (TPR) repeat protein
VFRNNLWCRRLACSGSRDGFTTKLQGNPCTRALVLAFVVSFAAAGASQAFDSIKTTRSTMLGQVVGMSPVAVELEAAGGATKEVPVNEIQTVFFETDPGELKTAKTHVVAGRYADAQAALERIKEDTGRKENQQDIEFYKALCAAKLAVARNEITAAGRMMKAFADNNDKSYHYFEASEIVGDLLVAIRDYTRAAEYYARLERAPWPDYKMRAGVAAGRALLAQGKIDEARNAFERVIANEAEGDLAQSQRLAARLGKAGTMVAAKKPADAIKMVEDVLKTANPEDVSLMARAYNVLGSAYRQAGRDKEALLAFLHVDVLYPSQPDSHPEALANLVDLWEQFHKTERANAARKTLEEEYKDSPWAKKGG